VDVDEGGAVALEAIARAASDVVVTDLRMPAITGIELLERARELSPDLIVIVTTACTEVDDSIRATQAGAEDFLVKPLRIDQLLVILDRALERRRLRRGPASAAVRRGPRRGARGPTLSTPIAHAWRSPADQACEEDPRTRTAPSRAFLKRASGEPFFGASVAVNPTSGLARFALFRVDLRDGLPGRGGS
jgi:DNA-binding response OmpR family regulator